MRCLLIGNYGVGNLGDELLQGYFLKTFPEVEWQVISARPGPAQLPRLPAGLRSLFTTPWWRTVRAIRRSDAVVFGGGTLFTDVESVRACVLWWLHARAALFLQKPLLCAFQGVGPFRTRLGEGLARRALRHSSFLSVRDHASAERVEGWRLNIKIVQSFDPVFSLISGQNIKDSTQNLLIVIPRTNSRYRAVQSAIDALLAQRQCHEVLVASLKPDDPREQRVCEAIAERYGAAIQSVRTIEELISVLMRGRLVLSERFHGSLAALALGKERIIVRQAEADKHDALPKGPLSAEEQRELLELVRRGEETLRETLHQVGHPHAHA